ncbi:helix-turn-helix domain-containing protein [Cupriavidus gilardii]|uniref:helix-turn-helix domain-containing protein n=1 Tax=Cupriavidus gilardii TaxID=82541 RepID=UPI0021B36DB1|nr:helix-turn-helix domain-containing protein [Cupriavidus gilardii]UXC34808.1 helix-turn-helix domain-containing protein [Cupriavidus gilardii]
MDLKTYLSQERGRARRLARAIGAHESDVSDWANGKRPIPLRFGVPIETATAGAVSRIEMFPTKWQLIWPELGAAA